MADLDPEQYFANKFSSLDSSRKLDDLAAASQAKIAALKVARVEAVKVAAVKEAEKAAVEASWSGQLGLESGSFLANRVNDVASLVSGTSRMAGQIASLPVNLSSVSAESQATEEDRAAYVRLKQISPQTNDPALVAQRAADTALLSRQAQANSPFTVHQRLYQAEKTRMTGLSISNTMDLSKIVDPTNRNSLAADMGEGFQSNWDKVTGGWDAGKRGEFAKAGGSMVSGLAGLLMNTGEAVVTNPSAVREYIVENAPQLFVGAAGKVGQAAMAASNMGYAADNYQQGIENYAMKHGGALPPEEERQKMAVLAASLAVAEHAGDHLGLKWMKPGGTGAGAAIKNTLKAGAEGFASEAATEGYQTWAEGEVTGKKATALDIYTGAVIGGVSGAGLSAGGRAAAEMAGATPEHAEARQQVQDAATEFKAAAAANDPATYLDRKSDKYDPAKAVGVLLQHANHADTTPEAKATNLKFAATIVDKLEEEHAKLKSEMDLASPEAVKQARDQLASVKAQLKTAEESERANLTMMAEDLQGVIDDATDSSKKRELATKFSKLDRQLTTSRELLDGLHNVNKEQVKPEEVSQLVDQASEAPVAERIINLSMTQPDSITAEQATKLAEDGTNALSDEQRAHLRAFAESRIAQNELSTTDKVAQEVLHGSADNVGISQWTSRIATAIASDNKGLAQRSMASLSKFADDHAQKLAVAQQAMKAGLGNQILKTKTRWELNTGAKLSDKAIRANGGLTLNSARLVDNIRKESAALNAALAEMRSATQLKFGLVENQDAEVQSDSALQNQNDTTGSPASLFREKREREGRVDGKENLPTNKSKTVPVPTVVNTQQTAPAAQTATAEQPAASEAKAAPVAEAVTADAVAEEKTKTSIPDGLITEHKIAGTPLFDFHDQTRDQQVAVVQTYLKSDMATASKVLDAVVKAHPDLASSVSRDAASQSPASPALASAAPPGAVQPSTAPAASLSVFDDQHDAAAPFTERNLVVTGFDVNPGNAQAPKPLASVRDFLTAVKDKTADVSNYLLSKQEVPAILMDTFVQSAGKWAKVLEANLVRANKGYAFEDMSQFLVNEAGGFDENVHAAVAYAIHAWTAENVTRPAYNTPEEINTILGRGEDALVSEAERDALERIGTRQNVVANALGQKIVAALGLKAKPSAPKNFQSDLEASIGMRALKVMLDTGMMERQTLTGKQMAALTKNADTDVNSKFHFVQLVRVDGKVNKQAEDIFQAMMGTEGFLDKLFGVESAMIEPSEQPIETKQKTTRNTSQQIPASLASMVAADDAMASYVRQDMYNLVGQLDPETLLAIAGKVEVDTSVHKARRKSLEAKNDGLYRELTNFMEYVGKKGADVVMHFEHSVWKQQRVGIATNLINPQTSKIHRHLLYRSGWETVIDIKDEAAMHNFRLRVAEGMGVKTDKMNAEKALAKYNEVLAQPAVKAAVNVLVKTLDDQTGGLLSSNDQAILKAGAAAGGSHMHSLDALMALAHYALAKKQGADKFTVQMMAEVDGVTNGPMFSHLLLGAANSTEEMFKLLNRGGFFEVGNAHKEYNVWRDAPGNSDLYETTALHMTQEVAKLGFESARLASLYAFTGDLIDAKGVTKDGRNIIKTPLTAMVFGSSVKSAVDSMADKFIESIYLAIEDAANGKEGAMATSDIFAHLTSMGVRIDPKTDLMEHEFKAHEINALKGEFTETIGKAVEATMKQDFAVFIEQRSQFNTTAQLSFELYNAVYSGMREEKLAELIKSGEVEVNPTTGKPLHDLTNAQEKELQKVVSAIVPMMHTPESKQSKQIKAGLLVAKTDRKLSTSDLYSNVVKFGQPFSNGAKSAEVHGFEVNPTGPGVAMVPMSIHSGDSAVSARANPKAEALNVHDAQGAGVGQIRDVAVNLNAATWDTMLNYSPASEITETLLRTIRGIAAMQQAGQLSDTVLANLASVLARVAEKNDTPVEGVLHLQATLAKGMAYRADSMKLDTMALMASVNQYAMEGGAFAVTDAHRAEAAALRAALQASLSQEDQLALDTLAAAITVSNEKTGATLDPEQDPIVRPVIQTAAIGKPVIKSEPALVKAFTETPVMGLKQALALLRGSVKGDFNQKLVSVLERAVDAGITIRYVTPQTMPAEMLAAGGDKSRGWYVSKGDQHQVYVLSPEFQYSGLTGELLLHELTHAALARIVDNPVGPAAELVAELEELRVKAAAYVQANNLQAQFGDAVSNVQELLAWGMSNKGFQQKVLMEIGMTSKTGGNSLMNGLQAFVDKLVRLVFGKPNATMNSGMAVLIGNAAGLFNAASQNNKVNQSGSIVLNQVNTGNNLRDLSTLDIHEALGQMNSGRSVSTEFGAHLEGLLSNLVAKLHGPFGTFKALMVQTAATPDDVYAEAVRTGIAPMASSSMAAGFAFTHQEAFVLEQVEATVREAMDSKDGVVSVAYRELAKLYREVKARLNVEDFHPGDWSTATANEKAEAKALHDYIFDMKPGIDGKSDYLSRFAAMGMAHEGFNTLLKHATTQSDNSLDGLSFNEKLNKIFNIIVDWFAGKLTRTVSGQDADAKLTSLVTQLVTIEEKKRARLAAGVVAAGPIENMVESLGTEAKKKLEAFGKLPFFSRSGNPFVQATGSMISTYAGARTEALMEGFLHLRDQNFKNQKHGLLASMVNEFHGSHSGNLMFHFLLRATKHIEGIRKDIMTGTATAVMASFAEGGRNLTKDQQGAVTQVFMRSGMADLLEDHYQFDKLVRMVNNPANVDAEIAKLEAKLAGQHKTYYVNSAKALGYFKAVGKATVANMMMNAGNIARLSNTAQAANVTDAQVKAAEPVIDALVSLYALKYQDSVQLAYAQDVLKAEAARIDGGNGVEMVLRTHKALMAQSKKDLFEGSEALIMKGFTPEVYDPYMDIRAANEQEGKELELAGYKKGAQLSRDPADPKGEVRHIYSLRDGGMVRRVTGTFSFTGMSAKGSRVHNGEFSGHNGVMNSQMMRNVAFKKQAGISDMFSNTGFDPAKVTDSHLVPVVNADGEAVNYRYLMTEQVKDVLLDRDSRPDKLLGALAGSIFDKVKSGEQNRRAVEALHEQYKEDFAARPEAYVTVGPKSRDPELREIWNLLPTRTKMDVLDVWGTAGMKVRVDLLDINFGYRKLSVADAFEKTEAERNFVQGMFVQIMEAAFHEKAGLRARQAEDIWQAVVKATKANLVVKSWSTMSGNLRSNWSQLILMGVNPATIAKQHRIAFKGAWAYKQDSEKLYALQHQVDVDYFEPGMNKVQAQQEIIRLTDAIARNPVKPLIDAGLMPTIVEDMASDDDARHASVGGQDMYSYKSRFVKKTEKYTSMLNPHVVKAGREFLMLEGSVAYKGMSYATQISDFLARYTLYVAKTEKGMDHEDAIQLASDAFINYDVPTHRMIQYANDSGLVMFTKYYMRIQKMLLKIYKEHPGRVMAMIAFEKLLGDQPTVLDSGMMKRWGNPLNLGALDYPGSLDALTTVRLVTSPFSGGGNPAQ